MNHPHDQDKEWSLVQRIRDLRQSDSRGKELETLQEELVGAFEDDLKRTARRIRSSFRLFQADDPDRDGIIENHLRTWILSESVGKYNPQKNPSFFKYVLTGWRTPACIHEYLQQFKLPTRRVKDDDGAVVKKIIRILSLDAPFETEEKGDESLGDQVEQDHRVPRGEEADPDTFEMLHDLEVMVDGGGLTKQEVLAVLGPLLLPECEPSKSGNRHRREKCTCPGCTSDEHRRREAMFLLLRSELSCPECSDEYQRRQWWNSLVAGCE